MSPEARRPLRPWLHSLGLLSLGLALLALLASGVGTEGVLERLRTADRRRLVLALLLSATQIPTMGLRWWAAMRILGLRASWMSLVRAGSAGNFINFFAPGHFGEALAAAWLAKTGRAPGVEAFSVLVGCKAIGVVLHLATLLACLPLVRSAARHQDLIGIALLLSTLLVATLAVAGLATGGAFMEGLARGVDGTVRLLARPLGRERAERLGDRVGGLTRRFQGTLATFARRPRAIVAVAGLSLLKTGAVMGSISLTWKAFGEDVGLVDAAFLHAVDSLSSLVGIWVPANLGVQEGVLTSASVGGLGLDPQAAFSGAIGLKAVLLAHALLCGVVWLLPGRRRPS